MNNHKTTILIFLSILFCNTIYCQTIYTFNRYLFKNTINSKLYMKDGNMYKLPINYNYASQEMVFLKDGKPLAFTKDEIQKIDSILIDNHKFIPEGKSFVEIYGNNELQLKVYYKVLVKKTKREIGYGIISNTGSIDNKRVYSSDHSTYDASRPDELKLEKDFEYQLMKNGKKYRFKNINKLFKIYDIKNKNFNNDIDIENSLSIWNFIQKMENKTK